MARIAGGGATRRNRRAALPSAQELLGAFYGLGSKQTAGISKITGSGTSMFAGLPTASNKSLKIPPPRPVSIATEITPTRSKRL